MNKLIILTLLLRSWCVSAQDCDKLHYSIPVVKKDIELEKETENILSDSRKKIDAGYSAKEKKVFTTHFEERKEAFDRMLENGLLIYEGSLHAYVQGVTDRIVQNAGLDKTISVYLVRDISPNAFCTGDNRIFIHLGLIERLSCEDELALVIGHELGHNELGHYHEKVAEYVDLAMNDSIEQRIKEISKSEYGRVTAMNKLMIPWLLSNKEKSRSMEYAADQYGLKRLYESGYDPVLAVHIFDVMENFDDEIDTMKLDFTGLLHLDELKSDYGKALKLKTGSSLGSFEVKKDTLEDMLRTHPFNNERKMAFEAELGTGTASVFSADSNYLAFQDEADRELIINMIGNNMIDRAVLYLLVRCKKNPDDLFVRKYLPFSFAYLGWAKERFKSGKLIDTQSPYNNDNYNELIYFMRSISPSQCIEIANLWNQRFNNYLSCDCSNLSQAVLDYLDDDTETYELRKSKEENRSSNLILSILDGLNTN